MKMTDEAGDIKGVLNPSEAPGSPSKGGFSSGSEECGEEWASCAGELERGAVCDSPPVAISPTGKISEFLYGARFRNFSPDGQTELKLGVEQKLGIKGQHIGVKQGMSDDPIQKCHSPDKEGSEILHSSKTFLENTNEKKKTCFMRNASYQKAVSKRDSKDRRPVTVHVMGDEPNELQEVSEEVETHEKIEVRSMEFRNVSPEQLLENEGFVSPPSSPEKEPKEIAVSHLPRSASFNDRLLESPRKTSPEPLKIELPPMGRRGSISNPGTPTIAIRRLISSPGRFQGSTGSCSPDFDFLHDLPSTEPPHKRSIKNLTSNLARKLSFRKYKTVQKKTGENFMNTQFANGLPPSTDGVVSYEGLLRLFECPGCNIMMSPPLIQCRKGHLVCDKCRTSFKATCPICKQRVTDTTNYMMEQVFQLVRFPCRFVRYGCREYHPPKQKSDHEHFCVYRPVYCHYSTSGCECVLPLKDMNDHILICKFKMIERGTPKL